MTSPFCRRLLVPLLAVCWLGVGGLSPAYASGNTARTPDVHRIAVVNMDEVYRDSSLAVKAIKKLEREFASREQELQRQARTLRDLQAALEKEGSTLSETDRRTRERDLAGQTRAYQQAQQKFREDYNLRRNEENAVLQERIKRAIIEVAQREQMDFVLYEGVFYARNSFDITEKVIRQMGDR